MRTSAALLKKRFDDQNWRLRIAANGHGNELMCETV